MAWASERQWNVLLHFSPDGVGRSRLEPGPFFIHPKGHLDPLKERQATLEVLQHPEPFLARGLGHPQCLWPARMRVLRAEGEVLPAPVDCPALKEFRRIYHAHDVALAYAGPFMSNPGSAFGHTFFLFKDRSLPENFQIAHNYAALMPEEVGAWDYIVKGLGGGFQGVFDTFPYYEKLQEYLRMEQRDVWEYELKLTTKQHELLVDHLWELKVGAKTRYFFLEENCSHMLLAALQAVMPERKIIDRLQAFAIPLETVRVAQTVGLLKSETYRPSLRSQLIERYDALSATGRQRIRRKEAKGLSEMDALITYYALLRERGEGKLFAGDREGRKQLLLRRAQNPGTPKPLQRRPLAPLSGDPPRHFEINAGAQTYQGNFLEGVLRPGLHDYYDHEGGQLFHSALNLLNLRFRQLERGNFFMQSVTLGEIANSPFFSLIDKEMSFRARLGWSRQWSDACRGCGIGSGEVGAGINLSLGSGWNALLIESVRYEVSSRFVRGQRLWAIPEMTVLRSGWGGKWGLGGNYQHEYLGSQGLERREVFSELRWHRLLSGWDLNARATRGWWSQGWHEDSEIRAGVVKAF